MYNFESLLEAFYGRVVMQGDTCVDVGAHTGRHTLPLAALVGSKGRIVAIEPLVDYGNILLSKAKSARVKNISLFSGALGAHAGKSPFVFAIDAPEYSGLLERIYDIPTRTKMIEVETRTLDELMRSDRGPVRYIKIDTEGGEWGVIQGATLTIDRWRPVISFEFGANSYAKYEVDPVEVYDSFDARRYKIADILGRSLDRDAFAQSAVKQEVWDYVAVPSEHAVKLISILESNAANAPS